MEDPDKINKKNIPLSGGKKAIRTEADIADPFCRDLVRGIDHGIVWEADEQLRFCLVSKRAEQILGYPIEQWCREPDFWINHIPPEERDSVQSMFRRVLQEGDQTCEHRFIAADGRVVWLHTGLRAASEKDTVLYRGLSVDITRQKEAEERLKQKTKEAEEANQTKSYFLSVASHEIRNALNAIIGYSSLLEKGLIEEEKRKETYRGIYRNAKDLIDLVNRILDVNKIEAGEMYLQAQITELSLSEMLKQILDDLRMIWEEKGLTVELIDDPSVPSIRSDPGKLRQIFINLLMNAIKFTDTGSITVRIIHHCEERKYCVEIEDTGIGIDKKELPELFKPFYQTGASLTRPGVGLGLAIVKKLVEFLNGTIEVKSQLGVGSTFAVSFPYDVSREK